MAGGWCHVTGRGNERKRVFRDDQDRARFLELVGERGGVFYGAAARRLRVEGVEGCKDEGRSLGKKIPAASLLPLNSVLPFAAQPSRLRAHVWLAAAVQMAAGASCGSESG
jgi:hypothetical protein